ncbi:hypothetical protein WAI453_011905 [Rhynchosporium graminicola]
MSILSLFRNPAVLGTLNISTLLGVGAGTYLLRSHMLELSEDHEARMLLYLIFNGLCMVALCGTVPCYTDELEGTLRGHIGLIEEALDRLEGKATEADRGKKMNEYYMKRGRDDPRAK